jgi:hypothetical protein
MVMPTVLGADPFELVSNSQLRFFGPIVGDVRFTGTTGPTDLCVYDGTELSWYGDGADQSAWSADARWKLCPRRECRSLPHLPAEYNLSRCEIPVRSGQSCHFNCSAPDLYGRSVGYTNSIKCADGVWEVGACGPFNIRSGTCEYQDTCLISHGWPDPYGPDDACEVRITTDMTFGADAFATEKGQDILTVDVDYSGHDGPASVTVKAGDRISWATDSSVVDSGWKLCPWVGCMTLPPGLPTAQEFEELLLLNDPSGNTSFVDCAVPAATGYTCNMACERGVSTLLCENGRWSSEGPCQLPCASDPTPLPNTTLSAEPVPVPSRYVTHCGRGAEDPLLLTDTRKLGEAVQVQPTNCQGSSNSCRATCFNDMIGQVDLTETSMDEVIGPYFMTTDEQKDEFCCSICNAEERCEFWLHNQTHCWTKRKFMRCGNKYKEEIRRGSKKQLGPRMCDGDAKTPWLSAKHPVFRPITLDFEFPIEMEHKHNRINSISFDTRTVFSPENMIRDASLFALPRFDNERT